MTEVTRFVDISQWNGTVNFEQVKADGYTGVILRALSTNTNGLYVDKYFEKNYANAKLAGLNVGAYFFSYARDEAYLNKELSMFRQVITGKELDLPIIIDYEDSSTASAIGRAKATQLIKKACAEMQSWGYYSMWYTYKSFIEKYVDVSQLTDYDLWLAWYTSTIPKSWTIPYGIWQNSSDGAVKGVSGRCDVNKAYKDYPKSIKAKGLNGYAKPVCDYPARLAIGPASTGDVNRILTELAELTIIAEENDGWIYTQDKVNTEAQAKLNSLCSQLKIGIKEYVGITFVSQEGNNEQDSENKSENQDTANPPEIERLDEAQSKVLKLIEWLCKLFKIEL